MDKPLKSNIEGVFCTLPLPKGTAMLSVHELHAGIINASNKGELITELMKFVSAHGGMSNASPEVWDKLKKATEKKH